MVAVTSSNLGEAEGMFRNKVACSFEAMHPVDKTAPLN